MEKLEKPLKDSSGAGRNYFRKNQQQQQNTKLFLLQQNKSRKWTLPAALKELNYQTVLCHRMVLINLRILRHRLLIQVKDTITNQFQVLAQSDHHFHPQLLMVELRHHQRLSAQQALVQYLDTKEMLLTMKTPPLVVLLGKENASCFINHSISSFLQYVHTFECKKR